MSKVKFTCRTVACKYNFSHIFLAFFQFGCKGSFGYYRSDEYSENGYGGSAAGTYKACIGFSKESLQPFIGSSIKHFRFALIDKNISNVKFWIGSSREKMDLYLQNIENVELGWNILSLEKPYTITGDSLYMGIEYKAGNSVYPISYILGNQYSNTHAAEPGSAILYGPYGENNQYEWSDENECLAMHCILEGNSLPLYDIHVSSIRFNDYFAPYYYKADDKTHMQYSIWLKNWGKKFVNDNYHIKAEIDGQTIEGEYDGNPLNGPYAYSSSYSFNIPEGLSVGPHQLKIYVDEINGKEPEFPDDDCGFYTIRIYKEGMKRQKILMENITSTWCHDALHTNERQDLFLDENKDLALVNLHCRDDLTSKASEEYFNRYNGVIGLVLDANRYYSASTENFELIRNTPAFADVNISAELDKSKRIMNITVEGDRNSEFVLLHSSSRLSVYLTEDNLVAPQYDELNGTYISNYKHKGVLQASVSNLWGDDIVWNEDHYRMKYSIHLENEWKIENMHIIAFIEEDLKDKTSGKPVINCNEMMVKDAKIVEFLLETIDKTQNITFSDYITEATDLSNTVIDNTYYNMDAENGDGYDAIEQAIVLNSITSEEQMSAVEDAEVGDTIVNENYHGIIFRVPVGKGIVTVDVKTIGTHVVNVQIGKGEPTKVTKSERGTVDVAYNVTEPTYVYLYASTNGSATSRRAPSVGANCVLFYGYKVTLDDTAIHELKMDEVVDFYNLQGHKVHTKATNLEGLPKGLYIVNGMKVVIN